MGQKVNPIAVRLGFNRNSDSSWFSDYYYATLFFQDFQLRNSLNSLKQPSGNKLGLRTAKCIIHHYPKKSSIHLFCLGSSCRQKKYYRGTLLEGTKFKILNELYEAVHRPVKYSNDRRTFYQLALDNTKTIASRTGLSMHLGLLEQATDNIESAVDKVRQRRPTGRGDAEELMSLRPFEGQATDTERKTGGPEGERPNEQAADRERQFNSALEWPTLNLPLTKLFLTKKAPFIKVHHLFSSSGWTSIACKPVIKRTTYGPPLLMDKQPPHNIAGAGLEARVRSTSDFRSARRKELAFAGRQETGDPYRSLVRPDARTLGSRSGAPKVAGASHPTSRQGPPYNRERQKELFPSFLSEGLTTPSIITPKLPAAYLSPFNNSFYRDVFLRTSFSELGAGNFIVMEYYLKKKSCRLGCVSTSDPQYRERHRQKPPIGSAGGEPGDSFTRLRRALPPVKFSDHVAKADQINVKYGYFGGRRAELQATLENLAFRANCLELSVVKSRHYYLSNLQNLLWNYTNTLTSIKPVQVTTIYQSASLVAQEISFQLEQTKSFRQICKTIFKEIEQQKFIKGIRIACSGRLNGAEIAKTECKKYGETSLHVFSDQIDYAAKPASTPYGTLGLKVWISYLQ